MICSFFLKRISFFLSEIPYRSVTLAFWTLGRLGDNFIKNTIMMLWYWAAQIAGAFVSAIIVYLVYFDAENAISTPDDYEMVCIYATCPTRLYDLSPVNWS